MKVNLQPQKHLNDLKEVVENKIYGKVKKRWLIITIIVAVFVMALIFATAVLAFEVKYQNKFFPGSRIGDISLEGLTQPEALEVISQITEQLERQEIKILYKNNGRSQLTITPSINALDDPDLSRELLRFDNHKTIAEAFSFGRSKSWWLNIINQARMLSYDKYFPASLSLDDSMMKLLIKQGLSEIETVAQNAAVKITWQGDDYLVEFVPEQEGITVDYDEAINKIKNNLKQLKNNQIEITKQATAPVTRLSEVTDKEYLVRQVLATTTPELTYQDKKWTISKTDLSLVMEFQKDENSNIIVGLNQEKFVSWLEQNVSPQINTEPKNATIEISDGKVTKFEAHRDGLNINLEETYQKINHYLGQGNLKVEIVVRATSPKIVTGDINSMGIKEIIGTGHSNFAGSPNNRRHNIKTGADKLHGILIKPDEEFSLIQALGEIDGAHGYKQELVIKGNKTIPEYGGGLCQIGTTTFRAALESGLPITARRSHSYNVTYYLENGLPGTDATIYDPSPDLRFINDTGNYILIQTRIEGNDLYFDFWGAEDGRIAERTVPKVWNWVSPLPTKYIESLDIPVGSKRCTESAHKGVDASFDYTITYADGKIDKTTFSSHYKPWQAVCLIGVETLTTDVATSTDEVLIP
ncbi:MAG: VanW family protein [Candidatus Buchananbacteria bacterium]|nr:VanW family protein [Candidatus Buchananbacteria bacterium]